MEIVFGVIAGEKKGAEPDGFLVVIVFRDVGVGDCELCTYQKG